MCKCENLKRHITDFIKNIDLETPNDHFYDFDVFATPCEELKAMGDMICSEAKLIIAHACASHLLKKYKLDNLDDFGV